MSQNLLELVQGYFTGDTVRQTSTSLGEDESKISTALSSVIPMVLGGLFARSQQPGGTEELFGLARQAHSTGLLGNLGSLLSGTGGTAAPAGSLLGRGAELLRSVFGSTYTPAVESVSKQAGVSTSTISSLIGMAAPVVLGLLGRQAASNNLDANSFGSYLGDQRGSIMSALGSLPSGIGGLFSSLGLGAAATSLGNTAQSAAHSVSDTFSAATQATGDTIRATARETEKAVATPNRWPWILLLLAGIAALIYFMRGNKEPETAAAPAATTVEAPVVPAAATGRYDEASGNYIYDTGATTTIKLSDGTEMNIGQNSFEARLFNFLNDANQTVNDDKTQGWMSLDRVYFTTAKASLTPESEAQLKNVAAIMKAFPNAAIKFGGYTDSRGKADMNLALSSDRATAASKAIVTDGVDAGRVAAEGYGQEHPVASNDTPEGQAQNRRVDVRVTKK
nr:OmpA family [uncultured organism]